MLKINGKKLNGLSSIKYYMYLKNNNNIYLVHFIRYMVNV